MKKFISILIIILVAFLFSGCNTFQRVQELEKENARLVNELESKQMMLNNILIVLQDVSSEPQIDKSEYKLRVYKDLGVNVMDVLTNYFYLVRNSNVQNHKIELEHCTPAVDTFTNNIFFYYLYGIETSESCIFLAINQNKYTGNASRIGLTLKNPNGDEVLKAMFDELSVAFTKAYIMAESSPYSYSDMIDEVVTNFVDTKKYNEGRATLTRKHDGFFDNYMISGEFLYTD
jgi:hypothetical protein